MFERFIIKGSKCDWEIDIGLEIHAQIISENKLFSQSYCNELDSVQNSRVSFIDCAMPGMLPVLNIFCLKQACLTGLAINGKIVEKNGIHKIFFDRKNYFYPDLPQGYQITQFYHPIIVGGEVKINANDINEKIIQIKSIHIEQDAGKSIHDNLREESLIDLNRVGTPLMEIVTHPMIYSAKEAVLFVSTLRNILCHIGTCDGKMANGSLRCDVNVSVKEVGSKILGTRTEIKNLNSIKNIEAAILYEANYQVQELEAGRSILQETKIFKQDLGKTYSMRTKEDFADYRYFAEPDLRVLILDENFIKEIKDSLPELPEDKKKRYIKDFNLTNYEADIIVSDIDVCRYFERCVHHVDNHKTLVNWIIVELYAKLKTSNSDIVNSPVNEKMMIELVNMIEKQIISGKIAKIIFEIMFNKDDECFGLMPNDIMLQKGLQQVNDNALIEKIIDDIIIQNPNEVERYKNGKTELFQFFIGQIMKASKGKANPANASQILKDKLK